jgi:hypothetical protein
MRNVYIYIRAQQGEFRTHKGISLLDLKYRKKMTSSRGMRAMILSYR